MTDEQLAAIEQRAEAATSGPWCADEYRVYRSDSVHDAKYGYNDTCLIDTKHQNYYNSRTRAEADQTADMAFIAAARTDVPALLAEVRRLGSLLDTARGALADIGHMTPGEVARGVMQNKARRIYNSTAPHPIPKDQR